MPKSASSTAKSPANSEIRSHPYGPQSQVKRSHPYAQTQNKAASNSTNSKRTPLTTISTNNNGTDTLKQMQLTSMAKFARQTQNSNKPNSVSTNSAVANKTVKSEYYSNNKENSYPSNSKIPSKRQDPGKKTSGPSSVATLAAQKAEAEKQLAMLKMFSGTTKSIKHYEMTGFAESAKKKKPVGSYLFVLVGRLDSAVTQDAVSGGYQFTVADKHDRLHCIYFEMNGRTIEKIPRDSLIRCIGKCNMKLEAFQCMSVRRATTVECVNHALEVTKTNEHLKTIFN